MPSLALQLQCLLVRLLAKRQINSNYDPRAFRAAHLKSDLAAPADQHDSISLERRGEPNSQNTILYVPGGGFFLGVDDSHRRLVDALCSRIGATGWLLHYRRAPEHAFPCAFEDTCTALEILLTRRGGGKLVLVSDSAGGALTISACAARRSEGKSLPDRLSLLSPLTDMAMTGLSHVSNSARDPFAGPEALIHKAHHYLQGANPTDPRASPLWGELSGLPPMQIIVGDREVMLDDSLRLADRVRNAGGVATLFVCQGAPHVYPLVFPNVPESRAALEMMAAYLA